MPRADRERFADLDPAARAELIREFLADPDPATPVNELTGFLHPLASEYYRNEAQPALVFPDPVLPDDLTPAERREAFRACKGMLLRQETFAPDGSAAAPQGLDRWRFPPPTRIVMSLSSHQGGSRSPRRIAHSPPSSPADTGSNASWGKGPWRWCIWRVTSATIASRLATRAPLLANRSSLVHSGCSAMKPAPCSWRGVT